MKFVSILLVLVVPNLCPGTQQPQPLPAPEKATTPAPAQTIETEKVQPPEAGSKSAAVAEPGYLEPAQVKDLLHKIWVAEFRLDDLLSQVHPEGWKLSDAARDSFSKTLETLRGELDALEKWRDQFDQRTDSMYLGYETYAAMGAILPRLNGVARSVSQHENLSLGAQYGQAENQFFDLQQALRPYLGFLLRNQDQLLLAAQNNVATCQNELGFAMRNRTTPAQPIGNTVIGRPARRRAHHAPAKPAQTKP